jgi:hypothetical protein
MAATLLRHVGTAILAVAALGIVAGPFQPAAAHEKQEIGPLRLEIGWLEEPAYAGLPNAVEVTAARGGRPIRDADLTVVVAFGERSSATRSQPLALEPVLQEPGEFRAFLIPTRPGTYSFELSGTAGGVRVQESFTSGEKTFDDVRTATEAQFPAQDPTQGELAQRLERIDARLAELRASLGEDQGAGASVLSWVALGVAAAALVVAVLRRRERGAA